MLARVLDHRQREYPSRAHVEMKRDIARNRVQADRHGVGASPTVFQRHDQGPRAPHKKPGVADRLHDDRSLRRSRPAVQRPTMGRAKISR